MRTKKLLQALRNWIRDAENNITVCSYRGKRHVEKWLEGRETLFLETVREKKLHFGFDPINQKYYLSRKPIGFNYN